MAEIIMENILSLVAQLLKLPFKNIWTTYDQEADTLYINFKKPAHADDAEITDDDIIIRYENEEVIGVTILNASKRSDLKLSKN